MNVFLLLLDVAAILFSIIVFYSLNAKFKKLFCAGAIIPLLLIAIISFFISSGMTIGPKEILLFMLRGGLLIAVISGSLTCFLASQFEKKKSKQD